MTNLSAILAAILVLVGLCSSPVHLGKLQYQVDKVNYCEKEISLFKDYQLCESCCNSFGASLASSSFFKCKCNPLEAPSEATVAAARNRMNIYLNNFKAD